MNDPLLRVENLHVHFLTQKQKLHAVRGVSFSLKAGETLGIVGESGCGKSAMAKALVRLTPQNYSIIDGEIWYEGNDLATYSEKQISQVRGKEIGMIFQDPMTSLNPTMTIGKQIVEGYLRHYPSVSWKSAWKYAIDMLRMVGIPGPEERIGEYPHTLSGGMRQRVMIAIALACNPKILLADEPTTALDVTIQAQILHLMKEIQNKTKTGIILITHDLSVIAKCCDHVLVMYAGKIIESATTEQLFKNPRHPYTQRLLQAIPHLHKPKTEPLLSIPGTPPNLSLPLKGCGFCKRCSDAMQICNEMHPPFFEVEKGQFAACFKHDPRINS
ncbi:MAG: ABC transporter ATP-binding protein [Chlamydiales bacterium]|nr:ABC transporter ATP-binding protein [Chlamydiales bacterium]